MPSLYHRIRKEWLTWIQTSDDVCWITLATLLPPCLAESILEYNCPSLPLDPHVDRVKFFVKYEHPMLNFEELLLRDWRTFCTHDLDPDLYNVQFYLTNKTAVFHCHLLSASHIDWQGYTENFLLTHENDLLMISMLNQLFSYNQDPFSLWEYFLMWVFSCKSENGLVGSTSTKIQPVESSKASIGYG